MRPQAGKRGGEREKTERQEIEREIEQAAGNRAGTEGGAGNRGRPPTKLAIDAIWEGNGES